MVDVDFCAGARGDCEGLMVDQRNAVGEGHAVEDSRGTRVDVEVDDVSDVRC